MDDTLDSANETPFNFSKISLSLQKLAATKVASQLWRNKIFKKIKIRTLDKQFGISRIRGRYLDTSRWDKSKEFSCREMIDVRTRIGDMIDKQISLVGNELRIWLEKWTILFTEHLLEGLSISEIVDMFLLFFDDIVFKQDCTICVKSTVTSILTSTKAAFEPTAKYRMACEFCLENCVEQLWPLVNNNVDLLGQSPLVLYWNRVMTGKRRKAIFIDDGLMYSVWKENWTAAEYLWDKLFTIERTSRAIEILQNADFDVIKFLLPKLNDNQANKVCSELGDYIFGKMIETNEYFEYAMKSWIYMKDFISGNMFTNFIRQLWLIIFNPSESDIEMIIENGALFCEIWALAPDRLKPFVSNHSNIVSLFALLDDQVRGVDNYDSALMIDILADTDHELRRTVWLENWRKLVIRFGPMELEQLMNLCLANEEEIEQFKEQKMANFETLESHFSSCIENKLITELCLYLNYYVKNPRRLENLSKEIIFSNLHAIVCYIGEDFDKFHSLIHCTFRDSHSADKFTEELILAPEFLALIYSKLDQGVFKEVIRICGRFPSSERNTNEMKRGLVDYCKNNLARGQIAGFVGQKLENFLSWCSLNETLISEFKQSLNPDNILGMVVNKVIREGFTVTHMSKIILDFNNFLEWYFGSAEKAKIYKSSESVDQYLKWAFDNDTNKIAHVKFAFRV